MMGCHDNVIVCKRMSQIIKTLRLDLDNQYKRVQKKAPKYRGLSNYSILLFFTRMPFTAFKQNILDAIHQLVRVGKIAFKQQG